MCVYVYEYVDVDECTQFYYWTKFTYKWLSNVPCVEIDELLSLLMKLRGDTPNKLVLEVATELALAFPAP